tara:strand:- start:121 stop:1251 length:1131 start_codon:yes stop_codon:yes gene_type:complete
MGNSQSGESKDVNNQYNFYDTQLNEYKRMIIAQQEQINQLSKMSIKQNIQSRQTANMFFNDIPNPNVIKNTPKSQFNTINTNLIENKRKKLNPYQILGIDTNFDEVMLKKAYLKKAMKTHPDRGGSTQEFQKVSIAYTLLLKKLQDLKNNHNHNDLRNNSKNYMSEQINDSRVNVNMGENFDVNLFNKVYDENKITTPFDDGYGDWMNSNALQDKKQEKLFNGRFNKNLFNHEFDKYKRDQQKRSGMQLVKYENPEVDISCKGKHSLTVLGQGKISNFSGDTSSGLGFRDYKDAYTNSCLIDVRRFKDTDRPRDINTMESSRTNISYQMSENDNKRYIQQQLKEKQEEEKRLDRLRVFEERSFNTYDKIHQRLLNR